MQIDLASRSPCGWRSLCPCLRTNVIKLSMAAIQLAFSCAYRTVGRIPVAPRTLMRHDMRRLMPLPHNRKKRHLCLKVRGWAPRWRTYPKTRALQIVQCIVRYCNRYLSRTQIRFITFIRLSYTKGSHNSFTTHLKYQTPKR